MDLLNTILSVFSGGTVTVILKLVLVLVGIGGFVAFMIWLQKQDVAAAQTQTNQGRVDDQSTIDDENKKISDDAATGESNIEDIIKNHKPE